MNKILIFIFVAVYFALPKSLQTAIAGQDFDKIGENLLIWRVARAALVATCSAYALVMLFRVKMSIASVLWFSLVIALSAVQLGTPGFFGTIYGVAGAATCYFFLRTTTSENFGKPLPLILMLLMATYVAQYMFYKVGSRITASYLDPNISGYYLFLVYLVSRYKLRIASPAIAAIGALSLSRNFILAVILFEASSFVFKHNIPLLINIRKILRAEALVALSVLAVLTGSFLVARSSAQLSVSYGDSKERLTNVLDGSNYERAKANIDILKRIVDDGQFLIVGNGNTTDEETSHRPHNAFLRAVYRYGLLLTALFLVPFCQLINRLPPALYPAVISLFAYYSILSDFITGNELVLAAIILSFISIDLKTPEKSRFPNSPACAK